jgi:hypothetical protein
MSLLLKGLYSGVDRDRRHSQMPFSSQDTWMFYPEHWNLWTCSREQIDKNLFLPTILCQKQVGHLS